MDDGETDTIAVPETSAFDAINTRVRAQKKRRTKKQRTTDATPAPTEYGSVVKDTATPVTDSLASTISIKGVKRYIADVDVVLMYHILSAMKNFLVEDVNVIVGADISREGIAKGVEITEENASKQCFTKDPQHLTLIGCPPTNIVNFMATVRSDDAVVPHVVTEDDDIIVEMCALDVSKFKVACDVAKANIRDPTTLCNFVMFDSDSGMKEATVLCDEPTGVNKSFKHISQQTSPMKKESVKYLNFAMMPKDLLLSINLQPIAAILKTNDTPNGAQCIFTVHSIDDKYLEEDKQLLRLTVEVDDFTAFVWLAAQREKDADGNSVWREAPPPEPATLKRVPKTALKFCTRHCMHYTTFTALAKFSKNLMYGGASAPTVLAFSIVKENSSDYSFCLARVDQEKASVRILIAPVSVDQNEIEADDDGTPDAIE